MAQIVYGSRIAKTIKDEIKKQTAVWLAQGRRVPKLAVILLGDDPASLSYVRGKKKACSEVGIENEVLWLPTDTSEQSLLHTIQQLNEDILVDGILVQLPLPAHIDDHAVLLAISPKKDVDGFHPYNLGQMMLQEDTFLSCTPKGIMRILESIGLNDLSGKRAVVIGRSNIVGKPIAQLLTNKNATVTICHSHTAHIEDITSQADIVIAAIGKPRHIKRTWVKENAIVIDVGINHDENHTLCGDVDFDDVFDKVAYITPVPKGVGPMTIAMLLENTLKAYKMHEEIVE